MRTMHPYRISESDYERCGQMARRLIEASDDACGAAIVAACQREHHTPQWCSDFALALEHRSMDGALGTLWELLAESVESKRRQAK